MREIGHLGDYKRGFIDGFHLAIALTSRHFVETSEWDAVREILKMQMGIKDGESLAHGRQTRGYGLSASR